MDVRSKYAGSNFEQQCISSEIYVPGPNGVGAMDGGITLVPHFRICQSSRPQSFVFICLSYLMRTSTARFEDPPVTALPKKRRTPQSKTKTFKPHSPLSPISAPDKPTPYTTAQDPPQRSASYPHQSADMIPPTPTISTARPNASRNTRIVFTDNACSGAPLNPPSIRKLSSSSPQPLHRRVFVAITPSISRVRTTMRRSANSSSPKIRCNLHQ